MDVRDDPSTGYGSLDEGVQLFISPDGQLQMPRRDTLDFQIFARVACQLQHLCSQIFKDSGSINSSCRANSSICSNPRFQLTVDPAYWELCGTKGAISNISHSNFMFTPRLCGHPPLVYKTSKHNRRVPLP